MKIYDAIERTITECIREGILAEFLTKYRWEVKKISIYEYDEEKQRRLDRAEGYEAGYDSGYNTGYDNGYGTGYDYGEILMHKLMQVLIESGKHEKLNKAILDKDYRRQLYKEYHVE